MTEDDDSPTGQFVIHDPEAFTHNLARVLEEAGKALAAYLEPRQEAKPTADFADQMSEVVKTVSTVANYWTSDPNRAMEAQSQLMSGYIALWGSSLARLMGEPAKPVAEPDSRDRRFRDPDWEQNQFFDFLKQFYLITTRWAEDMVEGAKDLDPHTRQKAAFYIRQITSALAPSNFVLTNPELLRETASTDAENLVRGMRMLAEDIKAGGGELKIRQSDSTAFKLGVNIATTPGKVVFQNDLCQLIQYQASTDKVLKRPLLIVPPWINKFYILDLNPEKSFIRWCVEQGHTVFVISWVNPGPAQAKKSFEHYMREGIHASLDVIADITGTEGVNAAGYCVGGTLLSVALAHGAATGDKRIKSATLFATQIDFTHAGDLMVFADELHIAKAEKEMSVRGYLEGRDMAAAFNMLRPNDLIWPYVISAYFKGQEPAPFDLLFWNADTTRMPAAIHSFYLRNCYLENKFAKGEMVVGGEQLDLKKVKTPIYNLATIDDHIAPPRSVAYASTFFGGKVTFVVGGSGHIAGVINAPSRNKYGYWTGPRPRGDSYDSWIKRATPHEGSWWVHWQKWIEELANQKVKARRIGSKTHKPIEDAPGSYVLERI